MPLSRVAMARPARMSRSSDVTPSGYRSRVASRSRRWAGVEYPASSRSSSERRLRSESGPAGIRGAYRRNKSPGRRTTPPGPLRSMTPAIVNTPPARTVRQRGRMASRIRPMTASSPLVRTHLRIGPVRAGRAKLGAPCLSTGPADWFHTTRSRRCDRSLIAASRAVAPRCVPSIVRCRALWKAGGHRHEEPAAARRSWRGVLRERG